MTDNVRAAYYAQVGKTNESIALLLRCERVCEAFKVYADHKRVSKAVHTALMEGCRAYLHGRIDEMVRMKDKMVKLRVKYERMKEVEMDDMSVSTTQSRLKGVEGVRIRYERLVGECEDMIGLVDMVRMVGEWECAGRVANGVDGQREAWGLAEERGAKREGMIRNEINGKKENVSDERTESVSLRWAEMRTAVEMELVLLRSEIEEILQK